MAGNNPNDGVGLSQVQMQALTQHLERLMKQRDDALHERLDQMENRDHNEEEKRRRGNTELMVLNSTFLPLKERMIWRPTWSGR